MTDLDNAHKDEHAQHSENAEEINNIPMNRTEGYADAEAKIVAEYLEELTHRYGYKQGHIALEVKVPDQMSRADLVIFHDDEPRRPYAIIEFKLDGITDSEFNRAVERVCNYGTSPKFRANFVGVVAGQTRRFLDLSQRNGTLEHEANIVADLPQQYGKPEEFRFRKETDNDIPPATEEVLISTLKKCHHTLWGGGKLLPSGAFDELCKIIFLKINDEISCKDGEPYEFQTKTYEPNDKLYERIRSLYKTQQRGEVNIFTDTIKINDSTLRTIVSHIEGINFSKTTLEAKGGAFEEFVSDFFKRQYGQHLTPREIIDFAVQMMSPKINERILDPACGSGGFLLHTFNHVRRKANNSHDNSGKLSKQWQDVAKKMFFGIEVNKEIARVAKMNMILHGDGHTNIVITDALQQLARIREHSGKNEFKEGTFDLILTDPPFGAMMSLSEHPHLKDYELWDPTNHTKRKKSRKRQRIEILFIERIWNFLKSGGRAAVIIPDGILTNSSLQGVRDFLLERFQINAVVSLPQTAFTHFGTGVKASVVFLRRRTDGEKLNDDEVIFMALPELIGYDATGRKTENQLPAVVEQYRAFKKNPKPSPTKDPISEKRPQCVAVKRGEIVKRLDPKFIIFGGHNLSKEVETQNLGSLVIKEPESGSSEKVVPMRHENDVKYIRITDFDDEGIVLGNEFMTAESIEEKYLLEEGDILFAQSGTVGKTFIYTSDIGPAIFNRHCLRFQFDPSIVLPQYIYFCTKTDRYMQWVQSMQHSSVLARISKEEFKSFTIPVPPLDVQKQMVKELSRRRDKARSLREEAEKEWKTAKAQFEAQLLSEEVS